MCSQLMNYKNEESKYGKGEKAFLWFYGTFLECVCGLKHWGVQRWLKAFQREEQLRHETPPAEPQPRAAPAAGKVQEGKGERQVYCAKTGHCKYGGWSREGMARYNEFYHLVKADRTCEQAMDMERELLNHCIALKRRGTNGEGSRDTSDGEQAEALEPVEACWDLE
ncbi:hypothetical protein MHU86_9457 [Fragilaria crotonensis]|nr:hypothetical protein MHU86_9457 [Fragilaria crotonensis]